MSRLIKSDAPQRYTLGIVYSPDVVDSQGDWATAAEIEKACHQFMRELTDQGAIAMALVEAEPGDEITIYLSDDDLAKRATGVQHQVRGDDLGDVVENFIAPVDFDIPQPDGTIEHVTKGSWLQGIVWSEPVWKMFESGALNAYSLEGTAKRVKSACQPKPD